ncbi:MAG: asparagine synthase (glutamine-hydrolyzing) [Acidobacteriota bacterium]|nr:asparagine synthase (glutamine-hydrolyzing) [Acidobacteriota bacterium]
MCGIFGVWRFDGQPVDASAVGRATVRLRHRGPDDEGFLLADSRAGRAVLCAGGDTNPELRLPPLEDFRGQSFDLAFGFRRLSIIDLSPAGNQPMSSADRRLWIIFNGEIYNYLELRSELEAGGHAFRSGTDTEVILAAYREWGADCLSRFDGMFALAVWDASERRLFLARDRFGEKPLHYAYAPGKFFAFASEIKSLHAAGLAPRRLHRETYLRYKLYDQTDVGEQTFYEGVLRLPQAHSLTVGADGSLRRGRYWDLDPRARLEGKSEAWCAERLREMFFESVRRRLRADVPVGSSLSGGIDSSTVVSVMDRLLPEGAVQKTFSARFDDAARDEGKWMEHVTRSTRVEPHFVWPTGERMFEEMAALFRHQEEPFGSASIYAQWCVMRLAKENGVTVLLDGQGADEMLAGYLPYFNVVANDLFAGMRFFSLSALRKDYKALHGRPLAPLSMSLIRQNVPAGLKRPVKALLRRNGNGGVGVEPSVPVYPKEFEKVSALRKILWWHTTRQGLAELLRYADRNSMAHSREVRLPFLDHRLVEFVFSLPDSLIIREGWTKWILRRAFRGVVPDAILDRVDKLGYEPPQRQWLGTLTWKELMLSRLEEVGGPLEQAGGPRVGAS